MKSILIMPKVLIWEEVTDLTGAERDQFVLFFLTLFGTHK